LYLRRTLLSRLFLSVKITAMLSKLLLIRFCTTALLILLATIFAFAQDGNNLNNHHISLSVENSSISSVLKIIEEKTEFTFVFDKKKVVVDIKISHVTTDKITLTSYLV
jgi:type II secretory pathway component GspD/PulD (secretin)